MSATGRGRRRQGDDFYSTPAWATEAILDRIGPTWGRTIDPCAGDGAILSVLRARGLACVGLELDAGRAAKAGARHRDALAIASWPTAAVVLTNPPYRLAMPFVERALAECPHGTVAMLLRLNWLAGQKRADFHRTRPADVYVLPRRPSFAANGRTDATEYGWFVWGRERGGHWKVLDVPARRPA